jgi:glucosamine--fructose-6-phosphate aminotransferase (isomerizing)
MCGIVGYVGGEDACQFLIDGLKRLEYRGYDSSGIAIHDGNSFALTRSVGRIDSLVQLVQTGNRRQRPPAFGRRRRSSFGSQRSD